MLQPKHWYKNFHTCPSFSSQRSPFARVISYVLRQWWCSPLLFWSFPHIPLFCLTRSYLLKMDTFSQACGELPCFIQIPPENISLLTNAVRRGDKKGKKLARTLRCATKSSLNSTNLHPSFFSQFLVFLWTILVSVSKSHWDSDGRRCLHVVHSCSPLSNALVGSRRMEIK